MSYQPNADPIFGSRLYDLLKTCIPETLILDRKIRKNPYNQPGSSRELPSYFRDLLASPEITRRVRVEEDSGVCVIGRCFGALVVNKLSADINSRPITVSVPNEELVCLSTILDTEGHDVGLLLRQPGAIVIANMISFFDVSTFKLVAATIPSDALEVVQQSLDILFQVLPTQESAELQSDRQDVFERPLEFWTRVQ
ncbi:hypothetical protein EDB89DRAFT_2072903 [Lactarius sanguifluus]|nr:hypothetical protein EDB89DRAFT_2072903 [Lactarius sanguifluus]